MLHVEKWVFYLPIGGPHSLLDKGQNKLDSMKM